MQKFSNIGVQSERKINTQKLMAEKLSINWEQPGKDSQDAPASNAVTKKKWSKAEWIELG